MLTVLACITLFHCREQSRASNAARTKAVDEKSAELSRSLSELKGKIVELGDSVEIRADSSIGEGTVGGSVRGDQEKRVSGFSAWESEVLRRLRGI